MNCIVGRLIINEIALSEHVLSDSIGGWPLISFLRKAFFPLLVVYVLCDCHLTGVGSFFLHLSELILLIIITPNYETITSGRKYEFRNGDFMYNYPTYDAVHTKKNSEGNE